MANKTKLELTWIGKDNRPRLEPRILLEDPELSYCAEHRVTDDDIFDNILIHGDNLLALKALEQDFAGKVKCIFIDPPYNTGSAFEHYDDGVEHSIWLSLMGHRLRALHGLLSDDGSMWIAIDDNEAHYLRVLADEVFGRANFVGNVVWQSKDTPGNNATGIAQTHNHLLVYRKSPAFMPNLLPRDEKQMANYKNPDNDPRGPWLAAPLTRAEHRDRDYYVLRNPAGQDVYPPKGSSWRRPPDVLKKLLEDGRIYWGRDGTAQFPNEKKFLSEAKDGVTPQTWWPYQFAGSTRNASAEMKALFGGTKAFDTPKPEKLVFRVLEIATVAGDWVLDSFLGSGTTAAVAHKMRRHWIGVEMGAHIKSLCLPRLESVVRGSDPGGVTEVCDWKGGGGFRFYRLAPSLLEEDKWGNWIINRAYNKEMLAEAMCKLEGFKYAPSDTLFWMHGQSTEHDFIYVTTQTLTHEQLQAISAEVGDERTLLICCSAFRADIEQFPNLTVKKIPAAVLVRCEWDKDDYSLNVQTVMGEEPEPKSELSGSDKLRGKGKAKNVQELPLFADAKNGGAE